MDLSFSVVPREELPRAVPGPEEAWFDAADVPFPLTVRSRAPGDRVRPFGGPGSRKVSDVLCDARVPRRLRDAVPLVVGAGEVLWVAGVVRCRRAPVRAGTRLVLRMRSNPPADKGAYVVSPGRRC